MRRHGLRRILRAKVLILDEPASALGVHQTSNGAEICRSRPEEGARDRFTVLNRGQTLGTHDKKGIAIDALQTLMAGGRELQELSSGLGCTV